jgi:glutathione synthase
MKLGIIMDPISEIDIKKDSSFAMLLAAQKRGWDIYYMELGDLYMDNDAPIAHVQCLEVNDNPKKWYTLSDAHVKNLSALDIILMRKDPPFDLEYIYSTYILEHAQRLGVLVINNPTALRSVNEKFFITYFPDCIPPTRISRNVQVLLDFIKEQKDAIIKPLDSMGGNGIYRITELDDNAEVILRSMTKNGTGYVMTQKFLPEITAGDKRILLIDGKPVPYALARVPTNADLKGNLAQGAIGKGIGLTDRDKWICNQVGPKLNDMGLIFVGLDVIGNYLTEINVTSPTCIRDLDNLFNISIAEQLMDAIEKRRKECL